MHLSPLLKTIIDSKEIQHPHFFYKKKNYIYRQLLTSSLSNHLTTVTETKQDEHIFTEKG